MGIPAQVQRTLAGLPGPQEALKLEMQHHATITRILPSPVFCRAGLRPGDVTNGQ